MYIFVHSVFDFLLPTSYRCSFIFTQFVSLLSLSLSLSLCLMFQSFYYYFVFSPLIYLFCFHLVQNFLNFLLFLYLSFVHSFLPSIVRCFVPSYGLLTFFSTSIPSPFVHFLFDFFLPTSYRSSFIFMQFVSLLSVSLSLSVSCFTPSIIISYFPFLFTFSAFIWFRTFISSSFYIFPSSIHFFLPLSDASYLLMFSLLSFLLQLLLHFSPAF